MGAWTPDGSAGVGDRGKDPSKVSRGVGQGPQPGQQGCGAGSGPQPGQLWESRGQGRNCAAQERPWDRNTFPESEARGLRKVRGRLSGVENEACTSCRGVEAGNRTQGWGRRLKGLEESVVSFCRQGETPRREWRHLAELLQFALALQETLSRINQQSFNSFRLRIGA